jgi:hypothetical protein
MKNKLSKILLTSLACFVCQISMGQTNTFPGTGDVGIGTLNPENIEGWKKTLEIYGDLHSKILVSSDGVKTGLWNHASGYYGALAGGMIGTYTEHAFSILTNHSPKITVLPSGNVGVGTINPRARFDIGYDISNHQLGSVLGRLSEGDGTGEGTFLGVRGFTTTTSGGDAYKSFALEHSFYGKINNSINFFRGGDVEGGFIAFNTNKNLERMRIDGDGNIGIGTTAPKEKLSVNGKIRAHEIKVETANWPDYVFAKDYALPSLKETEKHIQEKGHLPGIPSAAEVKSSGIDLGEMNAKLLKKIEELTLYLIEQNKRLNQQQEDFQKEMSVQKKRIAQLEKQH